MAQWDNYSQKSTPADTDTLMLKDNAATGKPNKRLLFSGLWTWIVDKLTNAVINALQTTPKTVVGGINNLQEAVTTLNSKIDPKDTSGKTYDLNDLDNGIHTYKADSTHAPVEGKGGTVISLRNNYNSQGAQIAEVNTETGFYYRNIANNNWGTWVKLPTRAEMNALNSNSTELELTDITASLNQVRISGKTGILTISGTPTTDIAAFTGNRIKLPSGFRPFVNENFYSATKIGENVVVSQWQVLTDGNVRCGTLLTANTNFQVTLSYAM